MVCPSLVWPLAALLAVASVGSAAGVGLWQDCSSRPDNLILPHADDTQWQPWTLGGVVVVEGLVTPERDAGQPISIQVRHGRVATALGMQCSRDAHDYSYVPNIPTHVSRHSDVLSRYARVWKL